MKQLKRILVHFDNTERAERVLAAGLALADAHDAHLIGCAAAAEPTLPTYAAAQIPADVIDTLLAEQARLVEEAHQAFDKAVKAAGRTDRSEFVEGRGDLARLMARIGRGCDLVIVGQCEPDKEPLDIEELPDELVLSVGRPVLILPYIGQAKPVGGHVLMCWTDTREAARALADSLPLLSVASEVTVLTVQEGEGDSIVGEDAAHFLAAHGIKAEARRATAPGMDAGTAILNETSDIDADLIVMGAYGHSRLRETILGGTTRTILHGMTAPVLMSH
jgi:nucleotide-binding universal stress UspA family protein